MSAAAVLALVLSLYPHLGFSQSPARAYQAPSPRAGQVISVTPVDRWASRLQELFRQQGFLQEPVSLYNLKDAATRALYDQTLKKALPQAISRDTSSWQEIREVVAAHLARYPGHTLIVIGGASVHTWGALKDLEQRYGVRYLSISALHLDIKTVRQKDFLSKDLPAAQALQEARRSLAVQMRRSDGVAKFLGYDSPQAFLAQREANRGAQHLMIGVEETGFHEFYENAGEAQIYKDLQQALPNFTSVLYIQEDLFVANLANDVIKDFPIGREFNDLLPRDEFLARARKEGLPIGLGAFGWRDREPGSGALLYQSISPRRGSRRQTKLKGEKFFPRAGRFQPFLLQRAIYTAA